ncbi:MAG: hypothetical protein IJT94_12855 [Oscillibacter sp.]|nr:hypothetical protein [Oscillibacter sp.]
MKKWLTWIPVLCPLLLFFLAPPPVMADDDGDSESGETETVTYLESGFLDRSKMTPLEIQKLLDENPTDMPGEDAIYDTRPNFVPTFYEGRVRAVLLQRAAGRLSALRNLAGLPDVVIDSTLCEKSQYGAVLLGTDGVSYSEEPEQPAGMESAFYQVALDAVQSSNLAVGVSLLDAPAALMEDSDADNVSTVAHRRWQLYPALKKVGFGYVQSAPNYYRNYIVENVFDYSGALSDYHFISWPASGYFPADLFSGNTAWSVTLNPKKYTIPAQVNVTVTLKREEDGRTWIFTGNKIYTPADSGEYMHLDKTGYGVQNAIIFRPGDVDYYAGKYTVSIRGLTDKSNNPANFSFQVEFFDLASQSEGITSMSVSHFTDMALNVTATAYVAQPGRYLLVAAAYDPEDTIAAVSGRFANLTSERKSYSLMLEPCANAVRVKTFLLDAKGRPTSLAMEKVIAKLETDSSE